MLLRQQLLRTMSKPPPKTPPLTPQFVQTSLHNSPSDVDKLKLFINFAHHPNYFHNHRSFDYMVPVITRLTCEFNSVSSLVMGLEDDGLPIKGLTFLMLLRIYSRGEMYDKALDAFEEMERMKDLLRVCGVLNVMVREGFRPNYGSFFMGLDCLCKAGRMAEALRVLGLMVVSGVEVTVCVWSVLIDGFCKVEEFGIASCLLEKMVGAGHSPNVVTYTFLIKGLLELGMSDRARGVLMIMEFKGCKPDLYFYNVLLHGMSKVEVRNDVTLTLPESNMHSDSYKVSSYFMKSGFLPCVVNVYNDMLNRGLSPDVYSYAGLFSALCSVGTVESVDYAINIYKWISKDNSFLDAHLLGVMIDELIKVGKRPTAIRLFKDAAAKKLPLDVVSYTIAIKGLVKSSRLEDAEYLYGQMKEIGLLPNTCTCNYLLYGFCKSRKIRLIKWVVREMVDTGVKPDCATFEIIFRFLKRSQRVCSACKLQNLLMKCDTCRYASSKNLTMFLRLLLHLYDLYLLSEYSCARSATLLCRGV